MRKTWHLGRLKITFSWRSRKDWMGRFGGGWQWKLGIQVGGSTVLLSLLICELIFTYETISPGNKRSDNGTGPSGR
jgi:hypothetical protein